MTWKQWRQVVIVKKWFFLSILGSTPNVPFGVIFAQVVCPEIEVISAWIKSAPQFLKDADLMSENWNPTLMFQAYFWHFQCNNLQQQNAFLNKLRISKITRIWLLDQYMQLKLLGEILPRDFLQTLGNSFLSLTIAQSKDLKNLTV